jgi:hypothetical protein
MINMRTLHFVKKYQKFLNQKTPFISEEGRVSGRTPLPGWGVM